MSKSNKMIRIGNTGTFEEEKQCYGAGAGGAEVFGTWSRNKIFNKHVLQSV